MRAGFGQFFIARIIFWKNIRLERPIKKLSKTLAEKYEKNEVKND
jgi:hypothetical protein